MRAVVFFFAGIRIEMNNFTKKTMIITTVTLAIVFAGASLSFSLPGDHKVVSGKVAVQKSGAEMTINVISDKAIVNFKSFNLDVGETVNFRGQDSKLLARDISGLPSIIAGNINSDLYRLVLVNTAGIRVTETGRINAANLMMSTRDITDTNFINGQYLFERLDQSQRDMLLLNEGMINIEDGGFGVL